MKNIITLVLIKGTWHARFSGPAKSEILGLFMSDTIPTAYMAGYSREALLTEITANWRDKGWTVHFESTCYECKGGFSLANPSILGKTMDEPRVCTKCSRVKVGAT